MFFLIYFERVSRATYSRRKKRKRLLGVEQFSVMRKNKLMES